MRKPRIASTDATIALLALSRTAAGVLDPQLHRNMAALTGSRQRAKSTDWFDNHLHRDSRDTSHAFIPFYLWCVGR